MSHFDEDLRAAAEQLAREPLPASVVDEALDEPPPRSLILRGLPVVAVSVMAVLAVFGGGVLVGQLMPDPSATPVPSTDVPPSEATATCDGVAPPLGGQDAVFLHFPCGAGAGTQWSTGARGAGVGLPAVERLEIALRALLDGPSALERSAGMVGVVPDGSGTLLVNLELQADGLARIGFDAALLDINNLSTSAAGGAFMTALRETAFEFEEVTAVELAAGGSCEDLFEFFQVGPICTHLAKPLEPVGDCPVIPPAVLPSGAAITDPRPYPGEPMVSWGSGPDTVTELPGHSDGGPELPGDGRTVVVRGIPGAVVPVGDVPGSEIQIVWQEDGCRYTVWVRTDSVDEAVAYAERFGPVLARPTLPPAEAVTASVTDQGLLLTATLDRGTTTYGERVTATTTVENTGTDSVFWGHSGTCVFSTVVTARPEADATLDFGRADWPGDIGILKNVTVWIRPEALDLGYMFQPEGWLDYEGTMGCTSDYQQSELRPGERLTHVVEWDTEAWYGMPPPTGAYSVEVTFAFESRGQSQPAGDPNPLSVTLEVPLTVIGPDVEYLDPGVAFDALLKDTDYQRLLDGAPRRAWVESKLEFADGRWVAALFLDPEDDASPPTEAIVGEVDARTGEVIRVAREPRTRPGEGG